MHSRGSVQVVEETPIPMHSRGSVQVVEETPASVCSSGEKSSVTVKSKILTYCISHYFRVFGLGAVIREWLISRFV